MRQKIFLTTCLLLWGLLLGITFYSQPNVLASFNLFNNQQPLAPLQDRPTLSIANNIPALVGETVNVPIEYQSYGTPTAGVVFSIDFDSNCLRFDGVDEGIVFNLPSDFRTPTKYDEADESGEIDIIVSDFSPPAAIIPDGVLATLTFTVLCPPSSSDSGRNSAVLFSTSPAASFSSPQSRRVIGQVDSGSVIIYSGSIPTATPTITPGGPTLTATPEAMQTVSTPGTPSTPSTSATSTTTSTSSTSSPSSTPTVTLVAPFPGTSVATLVATSSTISATPATATPRAPLPTPSPTPFVSRILEFPVILQNGSDGVTAANFTVEFNSRILEFVDIEYNIPSEMEAAFQQTDSSIEVVLYTFTEEMPPLANGTIATIRLRLTRCEDDIIADDLQLADYSLGTISGEDHPTGTLALLSSQLANITCGTTPTNPIATSSPAPISTSISTSISTTPGPTSVATALPPIDSTIMVFSQEFDHSATSSDVTLFWRTSLEDGITGFHIWRGPDENRRSAEQITEQLILDRGISGGSYSFTVPDSDRENGYRYWLELITEDGTKRDIATIFVPPFRLTLFYLPVIHRSPKAIN